MDNAQDIAEIVTAICKDKVSEELVARFRSEYNRLREAQAECKRKKASVLVKNMARLNIEAQKLEITYWLIVSKCGSIPVVEQYLKDIKAAVKRMSYEKNHL